MYVGQAMYPFRNKRKMQIKGGQRCSHAGQRSSIDDGSCSSDGDMGKGDGKWCDR